MCLDGVAKPPGNFSIPKALHRGPSTALVHTAVSLIESDGNTIHSDQLESEDECCESKVVTPTAKWLWLVFSSGPMVFPDHQRQRLISRYFEVDRPPTTTAALWNNS
eukprot:CAMPEP_0175896288 /NCGR_PEP_ID=MMETSP0108-20121206/85_1 /TAXON_ID=195067 ORGANISM="Goniomonas pacifica, Strain CCMP1869" /NCGR_SAMPLE_ID=MMETSP0108 /ASSEMBLY_ACC=CAM_ASM_000204 /LENGTH=106 /DNA_ID=CAMNT_0017217467 /DNA_START=224 /DNA_END=542 /DNA_ORIENTATION=-